MGVKGLTTYIAKNAKKVLMPHELHDCNLVIDGDNLCCQLFRRTCETTNCAFGGDYDVFYMQVIRFFTLLEKCNVKPFVLLDGGYEEYRLRTVYTRLRAKIAAIKHLDPTQPDNLHFPLLLREVFVQALRDRGINVMRCLFEADEEVANLARKLNCPVLSYDSDFYIYNVLYIPFVSLTLKLYRKTVKRDGNQMIRIERCSLKAKKRNKKARIPLMDMDGGDMEHEESGEGYNYLDCCLYKMENLLKHTRLTEELLPLFGAIVGNDFTQRSKLRKFYKGVNVRRKKEKSKLQRQIDGMIRWLQHESLESALEKLEIRTEKAERENVLDHIKNASATYTTTEGMSTVYFGIEEEQEGVAEESDCSEESQSDENDEECEENDEECEENDEECEENDENEEECDENDEESDENERQHNVEKRNIPSWLKEKYLRAELPRYCVDLVHLKMYVNNPQIENFKLNDANLVALDILMLIFRLLNAPETPTLNYLTRLPGQSTYSNKNLSLRENEHVPFDPDEQKNDKLFKHLLQDFPQDIFNMLPLLEENHKIYLLAIIYWTKKSKLWTWMHIQSLILAMLTLGVVDKKCGEIRTQEDFDRCHKKNLPKIKLELSKKTVYKPIEEQRGQVLRKKITKNECVLIQERMLPFLSRNVHHKKSYTGFSSTVLHGFSEFQAILYHMITLNSLSNYPFDEPHVAKMYKGFFLYNLYSTLNKRDDPEHYLKANLLNCAHNFFAYYEFLVNWLKNFIPDKKLNVE